MLRSGIRRLAFPLDGGDHAGGAGRRARARVGCALLAKCLTRNAYDVARAPLQRRYSDAASPIEGEALALRQWTFDTRSRWSVRDEKMKKRPAGMKMSAVAAIERRRPSPYAIWHTAR